MLTMGRKPLPRKSKFARELTDLRERLGLTQAQAAEKVGVTVRAWLSWERGTRTPSPSAVKLIKLIDQGTI